MAEPEQEFDIEAARARYRAMMRGRTMRTAFGLTFLLLLCTWVFTGLAAWAPDVERLPGHDLSVAPARCRDCHQRRVQAAPAFNHSFAPTCGFCHRQALPQALTRPEGAVPALRLRQSTAGWNYDLGAAPLLVVGE